MSEVLTMSTRERQRSEVLGQIKHGKTKVAQAAEILGVTERQMYRLLYRYRSDGDKGLIHRLRGWNCREGRRGEYSNRCRSVWRGLTKQCRSLSVFCEGGLEVCSKIAYFVCLRFAAGLFEVDIDFVMVVPWGTCRLTFILVME